MSDSIFMEDAVQVIMDSSRQKPDHLKGCIDAYMELRSTYCDEFWDTVDELYTQEQFDRNSWASTKDLTGRFITPARVNAYIESLEAQVFNQYPKFYMEPATSRQEQLALDLMEASNNEWFKDRRLKQQTLLALRDCGKYGTGFVFGGYNTDTDVAERARKKRQHIADMLQADPASGIIGADILAELAIGPDSVTLSGTETDYEMDDRILRDRASLRHVPIEQIVMDPAGTCMEDIRWIGRRIYADYDAVMKEELFSNTSGLKPTQTLSSPGVLPRSVLRGESVVGSMREKMQMPYNYLTLYEIYCKQRDGTWDLKIFAEGHNKWLRVVPAQYDIGNPYSMLRWNHTGDSVFTISDIQKVLTFILAERDLHTRLYEATMRELEDTYGVAGTIKEEQLNPVINIPNVGNFIRMENLGGLPLQQAIQLLPRTIKSQALMPYLAIFERQFELGLGLGPNQQLSALKSATTATEAGEIADRVKSREAVKRSHFEDFIADVQKKRIGLMAQYYTPEMIAQTVGKEAASRWVRENFTTSDIQFGLSVAVVPGSMSPPSTERQVQLLTTMLTESMQFPALAGLYNQPIIALDRAKLLGIKDGSRYFMPGVTAEQIQRAAMQLAALGGGGQQGSAPAPGPVPETAAMEAQLGGGVV